MLEYSFLFDALYYIFAFILIISVVVFIHEYGHYICARWCGVDIEVFSIGMGPRLFGFKDKHGTDWRFAILPIGGYVQMLGNADPASVTLDDSKINDENKDRAFFYKSPYKKMLICFGGPLANIISAIALLIFFFMFYGKSYTPAVVASVIQDSPAYNIGIKPGDNIISYNSTRIVSFEDLRRISMVHGTHKTTICYRRNADDYMCSEIEPINKEVEDNLGEKVILPYIGISPVHGTVEHLNLIPAISSSFNAVYSISVDTMKVIYQMIVGKRSTDGLGGPIKIAKYSGKSLNAGLKAVIWFIIVISINLGMVNLLPIPVLDGGHIIFYMIEIIFGKSIPEKYQKYLMYLGMCILIFVMFLSIFNDIKGYFA